MANFFTDIAPNVIFSKDPKAVIDYYVLHKLLVSKVMRDLSKNDPARMVRYVCRFGHLWLAQCHPKPSLVDVVGLVAISIELWHVGQLHTSPSSLCCT
jgi:hypothetical protein